MEKETADALIGQMAADALVRDALLIALMELLPAIRGAIEAKVVAAAPGVQLSLPAEQAPAFRERIQDVLNLMNNA